MTHLTSIHRMANDANLPTLIRAALHGKALADARQRAALARGLGLTDSEVLAVQDLARAGELTTRTARCAAAALVGRHDRADPAPAARRSRHPPHPRERPGSASVRLTPAIATWATEAWAPFVADINALARSRSASTGRAAVPRGRRRGR